MAEISATQATQRRFALHIRDPDGHAAPDDIEPRRMAVYRDLFFNNVESLLSSNFPVIRSLYSDTDWNGLVRAFLRDHRCHTPLFPELGREFLRFAEQRLNDGAADPPFLLELAHYEWAELALSLDESEISAIPHDADGNVVTGVPLMSPLAMSLGYRFPVHRIHADFQPTQAPPEPTLLLLVRDRQDTVNFLEINPMTALLIERLQADLHLSGLELLRGLLADIAPDNVDALLPAGIALLADLKRRDAILGTAI